MKNKLRAKGLGVCVQVVEPLPSKQQGSRVYFPALGKKKNPVRLLLYIKMLNIGNLICISLIDAQRYSLSHNL
jgi:hypothetical protein